MGLDSLTAGWTERFIQKFADRPDLTLKPEQACREYLVKDARSPQVDRYVRNSTRDPLHTAAGQSLNMVPTVPGGFKDGDVVLSSCTADNAAQSGLVVSVEDALTHGDFTAHRATVSHAGIVARNEQGELGVIHFMGGKQPAGLFKYLTKWQLKFKPKFLRWDPIDTFFNFQARGNVNTHSMVMRSADPQAATRAARKAETMARTQIETDAKSGAIKVHPWYNKIPHSLAPQDRGGACSTFVDQAYDDAFHTHFRLPVTPEHLAISPDLQAIGDRQVVKVNPLNATA